MNCIHCGAENPEDAVFCMACGKRVDGKVSCPNCHGLNPHDAVFCTHCGARMDGKIVCPDCGTLNERTSKFCLSCGKPFASFNRTARVSRSEAASPEEPSSEKGKGVLYWLKFAGGITVVVAAVFALIFLFCIGVKARFSAGVTAVMAELGIEGDTKLSIYTYFGSIYKDIAETLKGYGTDGAIMALSLYPHAIVGTLVVAGSFVAAIVCVSVMGVRFARSLQGKRGNVNFVTPAIATYAVFLFCACAVLMLNFASAKASGVAGVVALNGATVTGIVLGGIFLAAGAGLLFASKGKKLLSFHAIFRAVGSLVGIALSVVLLSFIAKGSVRIKESSVASVTSSLQPYMAILGVSFYTNKSMLPPVGHVITFLLALFAQVAVIAAAAIMLLFFVNTFAGEEKGNPLPAAIVAFVSSVLLLVSTILFCTIKIRLEPMAELTAPFGTIEFAYPIPIVAVVFSALLLAVSVTVTVVQKLKKGKENV